MKKIEPYITKSVLRKEVKGIVGDAIVKFAVIVNGAFDKQQKYMDDRFDKIDERFEKIEVRLDGIDEKLVGIQSQVDGTNRRIDAHVLDYVSQEEHKRLEKRVAKLEPAIA